LLKNAEILFPERNRNTLSARFSSSPPKRMKTSKGPRVDWMRGGASSADERYRIEIRRVTGQRPNLLAQREPPAEPFGACGWDKAGEESHCAKAGRTP